MTRSFKKGPFISSIILKRIEAFRKTGEQGVIKTWSRSSTILPVMLDYTIAVYNGHHHVPVFITEQMIGHKLGEFSPTRKFYSHKKKDKKLKR